MVEDRAGRLQHGHRGVVLRRDQPDLLELAAGLPLDQPGDLRVGARDVRDGRLVHDNLLAGHPRKVGTSDPSDEILGAEYPEQPQLVRVVAARGGRERDHPQIDGGHAEHVTVHGDRPELGVMHGLVIPLMGADLAALPQLREPGAGGAQVSHQLPQPCVLRVPGGGGPEIGHGGRLEAGLVLRGVADPSGGAGEMPPQHVAVPAARPGGVADQGGPQRVPGQQRPARVVDADRDTAELVQQPLQAGGEMGRHDPGTRERLPGQDEQVLAFRAGQPQRAGQRGEDLDRRRAGPALFQAGDVVGRHPGQQRQFLAAQAGRPAGAVIGQARVRRGETVPPGPQRRAQFPVLADTVLAHQSSMRGPAGRNLVPPVPGRGVRWLPGG